MSQRTFSALDITGFAITDIVQGGNNDSDWAISGTGFGDILATTINFISFPGQLPSNFESRVTFKVGGSFNFQTFPEIPLTARITNVKLRYAANAVGLADGTYDATSPNNNVFAAVGIDFADNSGNPYLYKDFDASINQLQALTASASITKSENLAGSQLEYIFSGINYDTFVSFFQNVSFLIAPDIFISFDVGGGPTQTDASYNGLFQFTALELIVTYNDVGASWTIENDTIPVKVGNKVTILGAEGLDTISAVEFSYTDGSGAHTCTVPLIDFLFQSPTELTVYLANCVHDFEGTVTVSVVGNGTIFSDSIPIGTLTVFFEDGSGIYQIVKGKTTDTVYDPVRDGSTVETAIPDPLGRTGYIG